MAEELLRIKLKQLEADQSLWVTQFEALGDSARVTTDPAIRVQWEQQQAVLEQKINAAEAEIKEITAKLRNSSWQQHLPAINYQRAREVARRAFDRLEVSQGGVLFLLQRSTQMGGRWCLKAIKEDVLQAENKIGKLRSEPVGFQSWERPNEIEFLIKLAQRLNAQIDEKDLEAALDVVTEKLCSTVETGGTLIVEVSFSSSESLHTGLLEWLVKKFWCSLADRLNTLTPDKVDFKVVLTIVALGDLAPEYLNTHLGILDATFDFRKILELPLELWTKDEIRKWLTRYSGLKITGAQFEQLAETIHRNSRDGTPALVHEAFMQELERV